MGFSLFSKSLFPAYSGLRAAFSSPATRAIRTVGQDKRAASVQTQVLREETAEKEVEASLVKGLFDRVNGEVDSKGRLFAVVHLYGQQHLITEGDTIIVRKYFPAELGAEVKLEKCLLVGGENITLLGRPTLDRDLVHITATFIERTMSHTNSTVIVKQRSQGFRRWYFRRYPLSMLRINEIKICHKINESQDQVQ